MVAAVTADDIAQRRLVAGYCAAVRSPFHYSLAFHGELANKDFPIHCRGRRGTSEQDKQARKRPSNCGVEAEKVVSVAQPNMYGRGKVRAAFQLEERRTQPASQPARSSER